MMSQEVNIFQLNFACSAIELISLGNNSAQLFDSQTRHVLSGVLAQKFLKQTNDRILLRLFWNFRLSNNSFRRSYIRTLFFTVSMVSLASMSANCLWRSEKAALILLLSILCDLNVV